MNICHGFVLRIYFFSIILDLITIEVELDVESIDNVL